MHGYVYKIENLINHKIYVGQTTIKPDKRKNVHFYELHKKIHSNPYLQNSFNKYGESNFKFSVLNWANSQDELNDLEIHYITKYKSLNKNYGFNLRAGGGNGKHSIETRKKIGLSGLGRKHSEETIKRISEAHKGKKRGRFNLITRKNMSKAHEGKGIFGFTGVFFDKRLDPEKKCWRSTIKFRGHTNSLGNYYDPLTCEIVYNLVKDEIYNSIK